MEDERDLDVLFFSSFFCFWVFSPSLQEGGRRGVVEVALFEPRSFVRSFGEGTDHGGTKWGSHLKWSRRSRV